jgi:hypothetical protein
MIKAFMRDCNPEYALSLKQPWAALVVQGLKSIEVRRWATRIRGSIYIHAARIPDPRPEVWKLVPRASRDLSRLHGGIIGVAKLIDCLTYDDPDAFARDQRKHWNDPAWFAAPVMYGFVFSKCSLIPFRPCPGWFRFFRVNPAQRTAKLP